MRANRRILKEFERFSNESDGFSVEAVSDKEWHVKFTGAFETIYDGEEFTLRVRFGNDYPIESPEVVFLLPAPVHPHIYSNGHICLNILGDDWSPALTVKNICMSILSMLSSNTMKVPPPDNDRYVRSKGNDSNPKNTRFIYHDDTV